MLISLIPGILTWRVDRRKVHHLNGRHTDDVPIRRQLGAAEEHRKRVGVPGDLIEHDRKRELVFAGQDLVCKSIKRYSIKIKTNVFMYKKGVNVNSLTLSIIWSKLRISLLKQKSSHRAQISSYEYWTPSKRTVVFWMISSSVRSSSNTSRRIRFGSASFDVIITRPKRPVLVIPNNHINYIIQCVSECVLHIFVFFLFKKKQKTFLAWRSLTLSLSPRIHSFNKNLNGLIINMCCIYIYVA